MSFKYKFLLRAFRVLNMQRLMALPPEKIQKLFGLAYHGVRIPKLSDPEFFIRAGKIAGSPVVWYRHKRETGKLCIYLIGGGMLKYPTPGQAREMIRLARKCGVDVMLPYYPLVITGNTLPDVYAMLYALYKKALVRYRAENISFLGGSSGGNLALGLISYINDQGEGLSMPGKIYASSPGTLLITDEEKNKAARLDKTDVIMSRKGTRSVWEGMTGGKEVPDYMKHLQLGNYTGLKDAYISFGGDEVFAAAADSIRLRLEEYGVHVTMEIEEGLYHTYASMPFVKEAEGGYRRMIAYISGALPAAAVRFGK